MRPAETPAPSPASRNFPIVTSVSRPLTHRPDGLLTSDHDDTRRHQQRY